MYNQASRLPDPKSLVCPDCKGTLFLLKGRSVTCRNCGWTEKGVASNKFGAKRTEFNGKRYDSKYEAGVAQELELRKRAGEILDYDNQYKVKIYIYNEHGKPVMMVGHKVDFRAHLKDGSYELIEAKGVETPDYKWRRRLLEELWLPAHPDHTYRVVKQQRSRR